VSKPSPHVQVRCEDRLFGSIKERAMDGALEFDEHGRESNSNKANTGFHNRLHTQRGEHFFAYFLVATRK